MTNDLFKFIYLILYDLLLYYIIFLLLIIFICKTSKKIKAKQSRSKRIISVITRSKNLVKIVTYIIIHRACIKKIIKYITETEDSA